MTRSRGVLLLDGALAGGAVVIALLAGALAGRAQEAITLDTSRSTGPSVTYTLPTGASCSESSGDRPSIWAGGRIRNVTDTKGQALPLGGVPAPGAGPVVVNGDIYDVVAGNSVGVGIHLPFGGAPAGTCRRFSRLLEADVLAALVERLVASKAITPEDARRLLVNRLSRLRGEPLAPAAGRESP